MTFNPIEILKRHLKQADDRLSELERSFKNYSTALQRIEAELKSANGLRQKRIELKRAIEILESHNG